MAITTRQPRQQRRNEALQLISSGVPPTDAASQLTVKLGCSAIIGPVSNFKCNNSLTFLHTYVINGDFGYFLIYY